MSAPQSPLATDPSLKYMQDQGELTPEKVRQAQEARARREAATAAADYALQFPRDLASV